MRIKKAKISNHKLYDLFLSSHAPLKNAYIYYIVIIENQLNGGLAK